MTSFSLLAEASRGTPWDPQQELGLCARPSQRPLRESILRTQLKQRQNWLPLSSCGGRNDLSSLVCITDHRHRKHGRWFFTCGRKFLAPARKGSRNRSRIIWVHKSAQRDQMCEGIKGNVHSPLDVHWGAFSSTYSSIRPGEGFVFLRLAAVERLNFCTH